MRTYLIPADDVADLSLEREPIPAFIGDDGYQHYNAGPWEYRIIVRGGSSLAVEWGTGPAELVGKTIRLRIDDMVVEAYCRLISQRGNGDVLMIAQQVKEAVTVA